MIDLGLAANLACVLEATARKPGNVHRFLDFGDLTYLDFLTSAAAIAGPIGRAREVSLGSTILASVQAVRGLARTNTNLGIILLFAPMAKASGSPDPRAIGRVLRESTRDDARLAYEAIRLAEPGGLGTSADQDIRDEPTVSLLDAMKLAGDRDAIARQYAHDFEEIDQAQRPLRDRLSQGWPLETAIIALHLDFLRQRPDTLIERKLGRSVAAEASARAVEVLESGWPETAAGRLQIAEFDTWLRGDGHRRNPGATADLVAASLFRALLDGTVPTPIPPWSPGIPPARNLEAATGAPARV